MKRVKTDRQKDNPIGKQKWTLERLHVLLLNQEQMCQVQSEKVSKGNMNSGVKKESICHSSFNLYCRTQENNGTGSK